MGPGDRGAASSASPMVSAIPAEEAPAMETTSPALALSSSTLPTPLRLKILVTLLSAPEEPAHTDMHQCLCIEKKLSQRVNASVAVHSTSNTLTTGQTTYVNFATSCKASQFNSKTEWDTLSRIDMHVNQACAAAHDDCSIKRFTPTQLHVLLTTSWPVL